MAVPVCRGLSHQTVDTQAASILALDMYEHSYHMDYGAKAATYVDTFMAAIRWSNVDRLFNSLEG